MRQGDKSQFASTVHQLKKDTRLLTSKFDKMIDAQIKANRKQSQAFDVCWDAQQMQSHTDS